MGHRPGVKGGYFPVPPVDSESDLRAEMLSTMIEMGVVGEKHHHEVAQSQHELGTKFGPLITPGRPHADLQVRASTTSPTRYGKTATFMPKPIYGDNGSGMHVHQSIWKDGKPLFAGNGYADLSRDVPVLHRRHHQARQGAERLHQPATNCYKRLIPGFEAPVLLAYSARNRSASCRIPYATSPKAKRVEVRFPDPAREPLPRLRGDADGRPGRHPEQDPSGRADGQGPLRPAAGRAEGHPDRLRLAARGAAVASRPTTSSCWPATCSRRTRSRATSS